MNRKLFVDTNIVIDLLGKRMPFFDSAYDLFTLALDKKVELYVSSVSYCTVYYILKKHLSHEKLMTAFGEFDKYVDIVAVDKKVVLDAVSSRFKDFEDAVQYNCAIKSKGVQVIISRDKKDFLHGDLSVMTAEEYLKHIN